jgi:hypothetical protein
MVLATSETTKSNCSHLAVSSTEYFFQAGSNLQSSSHNLKCELIGRSHVLESRHGTDPSKDGLIGMQLTALRAAADARRWAAAIAPLCKVDCD